jgi:hypothetical protein
VNQGHATKKHESLDPFKSFSTHPRSTHQNGTHQGKPGLPCPDPPDGRAELRQALGLLLPLPCPPLPQPRRLERHNAPAESKVTEQRVFPTRAAAVPSSPQATRWEQQRGPLLDDARARDERDEEDGDEEEGGGDDDPLEVVHLLGLHEPRKPGSRPRPPRAGRGRPQRQPTLVAPSRRRRAGPVVEGAHREGLGIRGRSGHLWTGGRGRAATGWQYGDCATTRERS